MIAVRLPDGRQIQVDTDDPKAAANAGRLLLAREGLQKAQKPAAPPIDQIPAWSRPFRRAADALKPVGDALEGTANAAAGGATFGLVEPIMGAVSAGATAAKNAAGRLFGSEPEYTAGDAYAAQRGLALEDASRFQNQHPVLAPVAGILGGLASPGAKQLASFVGKGAAVMPGARGAIPALARTGSMAARSAAVGGLLGGVSGAAGARPGQELQGAASGVSTGAMLGAAVPVAGKALEGVVGSVGAPMARATKRAVNRAVEAAGGKGFLNPNREAGLRLAEALRADGASPAQLQSIMNDWLRTGVSPALMDVAASLPNGGQKTMGLLRGAALKAGPGRGIAMAYNDATEASLPGRAINLARGLSPERRSAQAVQDSLTEARDALALQQYREPYAMAVDTDPIMDAVSGQSGREAIRGATRLADANRQADELAELQAIRNAANPPPQQPLPPGMENLGPRAQAQARAQLGLDDAAPLPPVVRLGTLDHIKQGLNQEAQDAVARGDRRLAAGLFQRAAEIDDYLADRSITYGMARDNFHQGSNRIEGVQLGRRGMTESPEDYAAAMQDLQSRVRGQGPSPAQLDAGVGYRQEITDAIAHQPAGAVGVLKRLGTAEDQTANLATTFGPAKAQRFQQGINNLRRQVANSRFVDPSTGSQTAGRASDALDVADLSPPKIKGVVPSLFEIINKVRRGATLTDGEREALLQLGTSNATPGTVSGLPIELTYDPRKPLTSGLAISAAAYGARQ